MHYVTPMTNEHLIAAVRSDPYMSGLLKEALCRSLELTATQPTTAEAQTTVPTREARSAAAAPASTDQRMSALWRSAQPTTDAGPVEPSSGCAHDLLRLTINGAGTALISIYGPTHAMAEWCRKCGALLLPDKTLVPAVAPTSSISQSPASPSSAALPSEGFAPSRSVTLGPDTRWCCTSHFGRPHPSIDTAADEVTR